MAELRLNTDKSKKMDSSEKAAVFRFQLLELPTLQRLGFLDAGTSFVKATKFTSEGYLTRLRNRHSRMIEFKIFALDGPELLHVKVVNTNAQESFSLVDWLKYEQRFESYAAFTLRSYSGLFPARVAGFLDYFGEAVATTGLAPLLAGGAWEHIPFDWAEMR